MLEKQDLKEIKKIVDGSIEKAIGGSEKRTNDKISKLELKFEDKIEFLIDKSALKLEDKIEKTKKDLIKEINESEERIVSRVNQEVSDLSDINRAVITRTDEMDYRLRIVERKLGIKS